ncbi:MAG: hypothetical protein JW759_03145 [Candidatus Coatesbacteria bacterium]|nr:hypothetical protein [Candidatus Coatesbacteria bacterium]
MTSVFEKLTRFVQKVFKTSIEVFLEALRRSPNAQGYVSGSITELLLKRKLEEEYGLEVKRIREKWEGRKKARHHGDFYFRRPDSGRWYVIESKGVKSNSEKWHRLYNLDRLRKFLIANADKIPWMNPLQDLQGQVATWIDAKLPRFRDQYSSDLFEYEEIQKYRPGRATEKARAVAGLRSCSRDEIDDMIQQRLDYVMSRVKVLETHFVSGTSRISERTQATPRKDEFNVIAIDIALRYPEHKFLFANPQNLESSGDDVNHLQQNYVMGFVFTDEQGNETLRIADEWCEDLMEVYETLDPADSIDEHDMQIDNRYFVPDEDDG